MSAVTPVEPVSTTRTDTSNITTLHELEEFTEIDMFDYNNSTRSPSDTVVPIHSTSKDEANQSESTNASIAKKQKPNTSIILRRYACVGMGHMVLLFGFLTFVIVISLQAPMPTWQRIVFITLSSVLNVLVFVCYWITMSTPAGRAPDTYKVPDLYIRHHENGPIIGINDMATVALPAPVHTRDRDGKLRFCRACVAVKPDCAQHCYTCGECVLRFDHHVCSKCFLIAGTSAHLRINEPQDRVMVLHLYWTRPPHP